MHDLVFCFHFFITRKIYVRPYPQLGLISTGHLVRFLQALGCLCRFGQSYRPSNSRKPMYKIYYNSKILKSSVLTNTAFHIIKLGKCGRPYSVHGCGCPHKVSLLLIKNFSGYFLVIWIILVRRIFWKIGFFPNHVMLILLPYGVCAEYVY